MGHKIILNKTAGTSAGIAEFESPDGVAFTFEYPANHDLTPAQSGQQFAAIQKHLNKAVEIANGAPTE